MIIMKKYIAIITLLLCTTMIACRKFVVVPPPSTEITSATVFNNNTSAAAAVNAIYISLVQRLAAGDNSIGYLQGLAGDELQNYSSDATKTSFFANGLSSQEGYYWADFFKNINSANAVIEGLDKSTGTSPAVRSQLTGEAKFIRALMHFYLVNLYGDIPLVLTTDYATNNSLPRSTVPNVYAQIIQDLKDAQSLLPVNYTDPVGNPVSERVRPNKMVATALLSRVYLYNNRFADAETEADKIISDSRFSIEPSFDDVFLKTSREAIWQLQSVLDHVSTLDGYNYVLTSPPGTGQVVVTLSNQLISSFEPGDKRFSHWVGIYNDGATDYYFADKYKDGNYNPGQPISSFMEYTTVFRLPEIYLIRAEARIQQNKISDGIADLNILRDRARSTASVAIPDPLPALSLSLQRDAALKAVIHERQVELFTEWGHRWFDLKRTGNLDGVMETVCPLKNSTWQPYKALMPIPFRDISLNPNLKQNPGYQ